jgi:hypothetical protein
MKTELNTNQIIQQKNYITITPSIFKLIKNYPKIILVLMYCYISADKKNNITTNFDWIVKSCSYVPNRNKDGTCDQFKQTLTFLLENKVVSLTEYNLFSNFSEINNGQLFQMCFKESNDLINNYYFSLKLYINEFDKIINYSNNNNSNSSHLLNILCYIKSFIFESNKINYCSLSIEHLSKNLNLSKNTILKNISILEHLQLLYVYNLTSLKSGKIKNIYALENYSYENIKSDYFKD